MDLGIVSSSEAAMWLVTLLDFHHSRWSHCWSLCSFSHLWFQAVKIQYVWNILARGRSSRRSISWSLNLTSPWWFDESRVPDQPAAAGGWDRQLGATGCRCMGQPEGTRGRRDTPSLLANMCGFSSEEEMQDVRQYLQTHSDYQIQQVSVKWLVTLYHFVSKYWSLCLLQGW